ncbi:MAG: SAM domain-containing protein, partial [Burkholderiales bacterium]
MNSFEQWLVEIGLESYAPIFAENKLDFDIVRSLSEADLRELGLVLGDRKRLLHAVAALDGATPALEGRGSPAVPSPAPSTEPAASPGERRQLTVM